MSRKWNEQKMAETENGMSKKMESAENGMSRKWNEQKMAETENGMSKKWNQQKMKSAENGINSPSPHNFAHFTR